MVGTFFVCTAVRARHPEREGLLRDEIRGFGELEVLSPLALEAWLRHVPAKLAGHIAMWCVPTDPEVIASAHGYAAAKLLRPLPDKLREMPSLLTEIRPRIIVLVNLLIPARHDGLR